MVNSGYNKSRFMLTSNQVVQGDLALRPMMADDPLLVLGPILNAVDYGILLTDLNHVSLLANARFGEIFGVKIDDVVRSDVDDVRAMVQPRIVDLDLWVSNLEAIYADPHIVQEDELILKSPHAVILRKTSPILDKDGVPMARLWAFRDTTRGQKQQQIQDILHEMSVLFDPNPKLVYERIVEEIGQFYKSISVLSIRKNDYMHFQAIGGPIQEAKAFQGNLLSESYCQFCLEAQAPIVIQNAMEREEYASTFPARVGMTRYAGVPLLAPDGAALGTLCILDDRSHEVHDEMDLRFLSLMAMRISSELEREAQLNELESDLANAQSQLIQSEKLAVTGTLAASIAHDIRNILSAITLDTDLSPVEGEDTTSHLRTHLTRFNVLAHRLLSYAKPKALHDQPVCIKESLQRVSELLARHFEVARVKLKFMLEDDLPMIMSDPVRMDHLFINLSLNAIQAMKKGGQLTVCAQQGDSGVIVEFRDNGPGMEQAMIDSAFEPFTSTRSDGFGLGLYSCMQIVKEGRGKIKVDSAVGQGTTFTLWFPKA